MKKTLFLLLILLMALPTLAEEVLFRVDYATYELINDGDFDKVKLVSFDLPYLETYSVPSSINYNDVQYTVYEIGPRVFANYDFVEVYVPSSVKSIGEEAFSGCIKLTEIKIGDATIIGKGAFKDCK